MDHLPQSFDATLPLGKTYQDLDSAHGKDREARKENVALLKAHFLAKTGVTITSDIAESILAIPGNFESLQLAGVGLLPESAEDDLYPATQLSKDRESYGQPSMQRVIDQITMATKLSDLRGVLEASQAALTEKKITLDQHRSVVGAFFQREKELQQPLFASLLQRFSEVSSIMDLIELRSECAEKRENFLISEEHYDELIERFNQRMGEITS